MSLRPLPDMERIVVEQPCPLCGETNRLSLKDIEATAGFECQACHAAVHLSREEVSDVRDRIAHKFAKAIRLC